MATFAIGDIQGCAEAFDRLLRAIGFNPREDRLWLVGDLVNRGPESLRTLRQVISLGPAVQTVLGNHDLHLLALASGLKRTSRLDTIAAVLEAPDAGVLVDWLRQQPLAHAAAVGGRDHLMVHAGVPPQWAVQDVLARAQEVHLVLKGPDWRTFLQHMYADLPDHWEAGLTGHARLRLIVNSLTRLRFCSREGVLDLTTKDAASHAPEGFLPWFDIPDRATAATTVVFGHWSAQGLVDRPNLIGLDTGCVWGGALTAVRLEDRMLTQVACPRYQAPG